jgi:glucokinase
MNYSIGIDLGGTRVKAAALQTDGQILWKDLQTFDQETALSWAQGIQDLIARVETQFGKPAGRIGLAAPGLVNKSGTTIAHMPGRLRGLENFDWKSFLNCPAPVQVTNDAHAALLGEHWIGAAKGYENVLLLTLGTGVGGAVLSDGKLLKGTIGRAGHLGHISLNPQGQKDVTGTPGSLEDAIGNCTIEQRSGGKFKSTRDLLKSHASGDIVASEIWLRSVKALACGLVSLINAFDPEAVVLGGGIAVAGPDLFQPLSQFLDDYEWRPGGHRVKVLPASLGEFAGAIGAARTTIE